MPSILIIENNDFFRESFREILKLYIPSVSIEEAANANEAWQKIDANIPDIIFMDIHMPGKNGLVLTKEIRARYPEVVVSIFTNFDLSEYREMAYQYGVDHFLLKDSISGAEIASLIKVILSEKGSGSRGTLCGSIAMEGWWSTPKDE